MSTCQCLLVYGVACDELDDGRVLAVVGDKFEHLGCNLGMGWINQYQSGDRSGKPPESA